MCTFFHSPLMGGFYATCRSVSWRGSTGRASISRTRTDWCSWTASWASCSPRWCCTTPAPSGAYILASVWTSKHPYVCTALFHTWYILTNWSLSSVYACVLMWSHAFPTTYILRSMTNSYHQYGSSNCFVYLRKSLNLKSPYDTFISCTVRTGCGFRFMFISLVHSQIDARLFLLFFWDFDLTAAPASLPCSPWFFSKVAKAFLYYWYYCSSAFLRRQKLCALNSIHAFRSVAIGNSPQGSKVHCFAFDGHSGTCLPCIVVALVHKCFTPRIDQIDHDRSDRSWSTAVDHHLVPHLPLWEVVKDLLI